VLIITASPSSYNGEETLSVRAHRRLTAARDLTLSAARQTLRFGTRAKKIRNKPVINQEKSVAEYKKLLAHALAKCASYEETIAKLRQEVVELRRMKGGEDRCRCCHTAAPAWLTRAAVPDAVPTASTSAAASRCTAARWRSMRHRGSLTPRAAPSTEQQLLETAEQYDRLAKIELEEKARGGCQPSASRAMPRVATGSHAHRLRVRRSGCCATSRRSSTGCRRSWTNATASSSSSRVSGPRSVAA
jgi:hypothetical protein